MKHEKPGRYDDPKMTPLEVAIVPQYDLGRIIEAYPHILQVNIDEKEDPDNGTRWFEITLHDGKKHNGQLEPQRIQTGSVPKDTNALLVLVRQHYKSLFTVETKDDGLFDGLED